MPCGTRAVGELTARVAFLTAERAARQAHLDRTGTAIVELWDELAVPLDEREAFSRSVAGIGASRRRRRPNR